MTDPSPPQRNARLALFAVLPALIAFWAFLQIGTGIKLEIPIFSGVLLDTDSYMKLVRIEQWLAGGSWYDGTIARSNAPFGETLHWTRLFDLVLLAAALPLMPFMETKAALYWAGAFISPLMHLALGVALYWAARPLWREAGVGPAIMAILLTLAQGGVLGYGVAGRADHHALLLVLFALMLGAFLRMAEERREPARGAAVLAGAFCGVGIWASVEIMAGVAAGAAALGLVWIRHGGDFDVRNRVFAIAFVFASAAALLLERRPDEFFAAEYDRISVAQFGAAVALAAVWLLVAAARAITGAADTLRFRLWSGAAAAAACGAVLLLLFPKLLDGSSAVFDPSIRAIWLERVEEMQSLWPDTRERTSKMLTLLGVAFVALPLMLFDLRRWRGPLWGATLILFVTLCAVLPVAFAHLRFAPYAEIVAGLALIVPLGRVIAWSQSIRALLARVVLRATAIAALFLTPVIAGAAIIPNTAFEGRRPLNQRLTTGCDLQSIASFLNRLPAPQTVLTYIDLGPELLYRTPHRFIGSPYHRNLAGIGDTQAAFGGTASEARSIVERRRVDLILVCTTASDMVFFSRGPVDSLFRRLMRGDLPDWLRPVPMPPQQRDFRLFAVDAHAPRE